MAEVKAAFVSCLNALEAGELEPERARVLIAGLKAFSEVFATIEIETRLDKLERIGAQPDARPLTPRRNAAE